MQAGQIAAIGILAAFYGAYFTKMLLQRRKGIRTDQIGRGDKPRNILRRERLMKLATYAVVPVEVWSICRSGQSALQPWGWAGMGLALLGVLFFVLAMAAMRDNWRAGIPQAGDTSLVTGGIYRISRNPAFLGFDCMYAGLLAAHFNLVHLAFALWAGVMLHLQILQEERFLEHTLGETYARYKEKTGRYL